MNAAAVRGILAGLLALLWGAGGTQPLALNPRTDGDYRSLSRRMLESVNPRELELGTIAMALFAYLVAQEGL